MNSPYLWDKSGAPDAFTARLEAALSAKREVVRAVGVRRLHVLRRVGVAAAAVAAAAAVVVWLWSGASSAADPASAEGTKTQPVAVETDVPAAAVQSSVATSEDLEKAIGDSKQGTTEAAGAIGADATSARSATAR